MDEDSLVRALMFGDKKPIVKEIKSLDELKGVVMDNVEQKVNDLLEDYIDLRMADHLSGNLLDLIEAETTKARIDEVQRRILDLGEEHVRLNSRLAYLKETDHGSNV